MDKHKLLHFYFWVFKKKIIEALPLVIIFIQRWFVKNRSYPWKIDTIISFNISFCALASFVKESRSISMFLLPGTLVWSSICITFCILVSRVAWLTNLHFFLRGSNSVLFMNALKIMFLTLQCWNQNGLRLVAVCARLKILQKNTFWIVIIMLHNWGSNVVDVRTCGAQICEAIKKWRKKLMTRVLSAVYLGRINF